MENNPENRVSADPSPRLRRLLELLLKDGGPLQVDELAATLGASRRTIFREISNAAPLLDKFNLRIGTFYGKSGPGLHGTREDLARLRETLASRPGMPSSREERFLLLAWELVKNAGESLKLFWYSDSLGSNISTVSRDLDDLVPWFADKGLALAKTRGRGVFMDGPEEGMRNAVATAANTLGPAKTKALGIGGRRFSEVAEKLGENRGLFSEVLDFLTEESFELMNLYLAAAISRMGEGKRAVPSRDGPPGHAAPVGFEVGVAERLADLAEKVFDVVFDPAEREMLAHWVGAMRTNRDFGFAEAEAGLKSDLTKLAMSLMDAHDPKTGAILKNDEEFVKLLVWHLKSARVRVLKGITLPNPLEKDLSAKYPDVRRKTLSASRVLRESWGKKLNSAEVSFLQVHFLAARFLLGEKDAKRRVVNVGVVCESGLGTSYMLAHQLRKRFRGEVETRIVLADELRGGSPAGCDLLVSTVPLGNVKLPWVPVPPLPGGEDYRKIESLVTELAFSALPEKEGEREFSRKLDDLSEFILDARTLLKSFRIETVRNDLDFPGLCAHASDSFRGSGTGDPEKIRAALLKREELSSQVVGELGIVLLHALTDGVASPVFSLIVPEGGVFALPYFRGARSAILMLLPPWAGKEMKALMGRVSGSLVEDEAFLEATRSGNAGRILETLENEIRKLLTG
ncbi:MAG: PRD domain-containing protein [Deltaproteobacteria bacterium]|nr:PRD domain-containing protein [Deltaproteobacteria bacterium]